MADPKTSKRKRKPLKRTERAAIAAAKVELEAEGVKRAPSKRAQQPHIKKRRELERRRRAEERLAAGGSVKCQGFNLVGQPCKSSPLRPGTVVDGSPPVSGHFCLMHDPDVDPSAWKKRFRGEKDGKTARYATPIEYLAEAIAKAPHLLFQPSFEALGLEIDPATNELRQKTDKNGKPIRGATHIGFSREGVAKKSRHKDYALQDKIAQSLQDRVFGKARQAMELGIGGLSAPKPPMTEGRATEVAVILRDAGALPD